MPDSRFVIVHTAKSYHGAKVLAGFLQSEGVEAMVPGAELNDEFGMAQKLTGTADVVVDRSDLDRAREMVAAWVARADSGDASDAQA